MKNKEKKDIWKSIIFIMVGFHLLLVNTKVLYELNKNAGGIDLSKPIMILLSFLFAVSYSVSTLYLINKANISKWFIVMFAIFDGGVIMLWYYTALSGKMFNIIASSFYSIYTIAIMLGIGLTLKYSKNEFGNLSKKSFKKH